MEYAFLLLPSVILCIVLVICWIMLPFAIVGTKPLLRQLLEEQKRTNTLLENIQVMINKDLVRE